MKRLRVSDHDRFWSRVDRTGDCWEWRAGKISTGYGAFCISDARGMLKQQVLAHRWAYEEARGPIPAGLVIDHLCRNRACVNPEHMEAVTTRVNLLRGQSPFAHRARQTHCLRGHPFDEVNTIISEGRRHCRACVKWRYRQKQAEALNG